MNLSHSSAVGTDLDRFAACAARARTPFPVRFQVGSTRLHIEVNDDSTEMPSARSRATKGPAARGQQLSTR